MHRNDDVATQMTPRTGLKRARAPDAPLLHYTLEGEPTMTDSPQAHPANRARAVLDMRLLDTNPGGAVVYEIS